MISLTPCAWRGVSAALFGDIAAGTERRGERAVERSAAS